MAITLDDTVKYITMAKGEFYSRFGVPVTDVLSLTEFNDHVIVRIQGYIIGTSIHKIADMKIMKRKEW